MGKKYIKFQLFGNDIHKSILQVMVDDVDYSISDISNTLDISESEAGRILRSLERGGLIEIRKENRKKIYRTKQQGLF